MSTKIEFNPAEVFTTVTETFKDNAEKMKEAFGASQKLGADNFTSVSKAILDLTEANVNDAFQAVRKTVEAKDPVEAMEIQQNLCKTLGERTVDESKKIFDLSTEAVKKTVEPFNSVVTKPAAKAKKAA